MTDDIDIAQLRAEADYVLCKYSKADGDTVVVEDKPSTRLARGVLSVLDALEHARKEMVNEELSHETTLLNLEFREDQINKLADELGDEGEWSNLHDRGDAALELAASLIAERDALRQQLEAVTRERDEARAQLDAMRIPISGACVGHSELNGYIDTAEQCRDWLTIESANESSGKMEDFAEALNVVVDQVEKQRRRANWYEAAYEAGKTKLIEAALAKQAEAIAAFLLSPELANTAGVDLTNPDCPIGATLTDAANEIRTGAWRSR